MSPPTATIDASSLPPWTTHAVAILVGVVVTLFALQYMQGGANTQTGGGSRGFPASGADSATASAKKKKKRNKKKGGTAGEEAEVNLEETPVVAAKSAPSANDRKKTNDAKTAAGSTVMAAPQQPAAKAAAKAAAPTTNGSSTEKPQNDNTGTNGTTAPAKKAKKNKAKNGEAAAAPAATPAPAAKSNGAANSNGKNGAAKKEEAVTPAPISAAASTSVPQWESLPKQEEEVWSDVPIKNRKRNMAGAKLKAAAAAVPTGPASETITIDASKVGIIIGPKGTTMQALQAATGCKLDVNAPAKDAVAKPSATATVVITPSTEAGVTANIGQAKAAIRELERNGYAKILQSDDFAENSIDVHPRHLSELVGPGGKTIKAIQTELEVKVNIPPTDWKPNTPQVGRTPPSVKVGLAGSKDNVKQAKQVIQAIVKNHFHPLTHPGLTSEQVYVPTEFFHCVIGRGGSEIKHIKGNYQVEVYMPNNDSGSETENVIVVGKQTNVDKAIGHIQTLMDRDSEQRAQKYSDEVDAAGGWTGVDETAGDEDYW